MTSIASKDVTQKEIDQTVKRIESGLEDWRERRNASPDDRDHVIDAITVLGHDWHDHETVVEEIANEIFEDAGVEIDSLEGLATFCLARLKDEGITNVKEEEPKSEYLVHLNIQLPREKRIDIEQVEREINGALEVGLGSEEYAPGLQGAEVEIALAEEIG